MFKLMTGLPSFAVGVTTQGDVTKEDYEEILIPVLEKASKEYKAINFIIVLESGLENFTAGAWMKDIKVNFKYFFKWNKVAMVCNENDYKTLSKFSEFILPGEVKRFSFDKLQEAREWISSP